MKKKTEINTFPINDVKPNLQISPQHKVIYADSSGVAVSEVDVKLVFGVSIPNFDAATIPIIEYHTSVAMPAEVARKLANAILERLNQQSLLIGDEKSK
jgi:hypothetical protein